MPDLQPPSPDDLIDLEPTISVGQPRGKGAIELVQGSFASLSGETGSLRRRRLAAVSLLLAGVFAVLTLWTLSTAAKGIPAIWLMLLARFALAATVLALTLSRVGEADRRVLALEILLFGGMTGLIVAAQFIVNLELIRRDDLPGMIAFVKNGEIQLILLMLLFGTFIPHRPKTVAWAVLAMALAPPLGFAILSEQPEAASFAERFRAAEQTGSNVLFLLIGAGIAVYSSAVLNNLRAQLHEARKFGQYQLVRQIGEGGMGEVYLAEHSLLKRPCAMKLIKAESVNDPLLLARFEREVQSSARLAHHNTIEIYDYGHTDDGTFYYVMEYLQGVNLADLVRDEGALPPGRVIHLFRQVCAGLAEAHGLGLVHRDLKPANIFVARIGGESDVAKVLDFGLVKLTKDAGAVALTSDLTISGTPLYMSPEQALADKALDARSDVYALGAVIYHALTGRPPFLADSPVALMLAHARDEVVPPTQVRADVPKDLEALVLRCLAKKPEDRYQTVKELGRALASCNAAADWGPEEADAWWATHTAAAEFVAGSIQHPASETAAFA
jgi:serine/threonine-protein kinase